MISIMIMSEVRLLQHATMSIGAAGDRKQAMNAAIERAVAIADKASLTDGAVKSDGRRDDVGHLWSMASATCGFGAGWFTRVSMPGLLPPMSGSTWHIAQLLPLNVGPKPMLSSPGMLPSSEFTSLK